ncbi:MAG: response regulator transcription factor [Candidatus Wallbacteria bacterium]|nr:response regulator transcription factor [Candidatus Wallbacteria bacterium]
MRIVIADDDEEARAMLKAHLEQWQHQVVSCGDGAQAWEALSGPGGPSLAILDWTMPRLEGPDVVRRARAAKLVPEPYLMLLTGRTSKQEVVEALEAGADDYVTKPFTAVELRARVNVGIRMLGLQQTLAARVHELEAALAHNLELQAILPICSYCKKVRNDRNYWEQVENYLLKHSGLRFSHGVCPECFKLYAEPGLP